MTQTPELTIGAALPSDALPEFREWLIEDQRDLEIQDPFLPSVLEGEYITPPAAIRELLDGHTGRRGIHAPFVNLSIAAFDPRARDLAQLRFTQALEFAAEIEATHMVVHSPWEFFGDPFVPHSSPGDVERFADLTRETMAPIVALAEKVGCMIVVEGIFDLNTGPIMALVRAFDSDIVQISIDTGHAYIAHLRGGPTPDQWVRETAPLLQHLHLQDTDGRGDRHWRPGVGDINWYALMRELAELPEPPCMILELKERDEIIPAAAWLEGRRYLPQLAGHASQRE